MTLQSSGIIKLTQIAAEYGDAKPHRLKEFYGKPGLPSSGRIDFTDFYGKSNVASFTLIAGTPSDDGKAKYTGYWPGVIGGGSISPNNIKGHVMLALYNWGEPGTGVGTIWIAFTGRHDALGLTGIRINGTYYAMTHSVRDGNSFWNTNSANVPPLVNSTIIFYP